MSYCDCGQTGCTPTDLIGNWATGLWQDLGSPSSVSALTISGYALQPSTLGRLNALINTCFYATGAPTGGPNYRICPYMGYAELAMIDAMYRSSLYSQWATSMMGISQDTLAWTALAEGDSRIARNGTANIGKEYREMAKDAVTTLNYLANAYEINKGSILTVSFLNPPYYGYGGYAYGYNGGTWWGG